jgi:uracil-DNA glycosylase
MVVGQDWGDTRYYQKHLGLDDLKNPTMRTLEKLLASVGITTSLRSYGSGASGLFLTNAVLCLKGGGLQGDVQRSWFENCGTRFLRPQIDLIGPKVVVALGQRAYEASLGAYDIKRGNFRSAVESESGLLLPNGSRVFAVYHCGNRILNTHRKFDQQLQDWVRIGRALGKNSLG